jgi:hypothetical protein
VVGWAELTGSTSSIELDCLCTQYEAAMADINLEVSHRMFVPCTRSDQL